MTDTLAGSSTDAAASARGRTGVVRDPSVDAIRIVLLVAVFALHAMMCGVSMGAGGPVLENALEEQAWFGPVSWIVQIMPLFFIAGGFSSLHHWRSMRSRGASASDYVRARLERLVRPAIALVVVVAGGLAALSLAGLPAELVATAGFRIGQPLWFLGVYLAVSALVPVMLRAHERARVAHAGRCCSRRSSRSTSRASRPASTRSGSSTSCWCGCSCSSSASTSPTEPSTACGPPHCSASPAGALGLLAVLTVVGPYPVDMLVNLNPPTVCLVVLGVAQLALFQLARPRIRAWVERADASRLISSVGERAMTVYLWHMPVLIVLAGLSLVANAAVGDAAARAAEPPSGG